MMGKLTLLPLCCLSQNPSTTNFSMFHFLTFVVLNRTSSSNSPPPGSALIKALNNLVALIALAQAAAKLNQQQQQQQQQGMVPAATQSPPARLKLNRKVLLLSQITVPCQTIKVRQYALRPTKQSLQLNSFNEVMELTWRCSRMLTKGSLRSQFQFQRSQ
jgi:hypothetical protein